MSAAALERARPRAHVKRYPTKSLKENGERRKCPRGHETGVREVLDAGGGNPWSSIKTFFCVICREGRTWTEE